MLHARSGAWRNCHCGIRRPPAAVQVEVDVSYDGIVIDEAGQAVEAETLIPLRHAYSGHISTLPHATEAALAAWRPSLTAAACRRLILVGDPLQLPATVLSPSAAKAGLEVSLFERLAGAGVRPLLLQRQYRMSAVISRFSSAHFYRGLVSDAAAVAGRAPVYPPPAPAHASCPCTRSLLSVSVPWGEESKGGGDDASDMSFGNDAEVHAVVACLRHAAQLLTQGTASPRSVSVGVITPYREQLRRLRAAVQAALPAAGVITPRTVRISTVDGFQGQELDVVIISCVRSPAAHRRRTRGHPAGEGPADASGGGSGGIGFLSDARRLNVAVTRARHQLILVGNLPHLAAADANWRALIAYMAANGAAYTLPTPAAAHARRDGGSASGGDDARGPLPDGTGAGGVGAAGPPHAAWRALGQRLGAAGGSRDAGRGDEGAAESGSDVCAQLQRCL
jgi:senataxin